MFQQKCEILTPQNFVSIRYSLLTGGKLQNYIINYKWEWSSLESIHQFLCMTMSLLILYTNCSFSMEHKIAHDSGAD